MQGSLRITQVVDGRYRLTELPYRDGTLKQKYFPDLKSVRKHLRGREIHQELIDEVFEKLEIVDEWSIPNVRMGRL